MIKYASNAFLATKISFINEIANICESVGADVVQVAEGMGLDKRIGKYFLRAGIGYGGSCFPKDVKALKFIAGANNYSFKLLKAVIEVNANQRKTVVRKLVSLLGSLKEKRVCILGLAFKDNTDDVRESASIDIIRHALRLGARVVAYDPIARVNAQHALGDHKRLSYARRVEEAIRDSDAVVIATEWKEFTLIDWEYMKVLVRRPVIVDGRNILNKAKMQQLGYDYHAIGR
jgi:UDPglucose 6-dehydrogenase